MNQNFNLLFYPKKQKKHNEDGLSPIYLRISVGGKRSEISIGREIHPDQWDNRRNKVIGTRMESRVLNDYMNSIIAKIRKIHTGMIDRDEEIDAETIRNNYLGKGTKWKMILEIFQEHNEKFAELVGNGYSANTLKTYRSSIKHLSAYIVLKYDKPDYPLVKVNFEFITGYEHYLRVEKGCMAISAQKYIVHLKKMIFFSLASGWIVANPFLHYKLNAKPSARTFLTQTELDTMRAKTLHVQRHIQVRDIFVFSCYTGLAYIDVQKLQRSEVQIGDDGKEWIFTSRTKTKTPSRIPILAEAKEILDRYKKHPICEIKGLALPVYSNQRMNSYLKEIADHCGITKILTFHLARHTFATTVTLSNGVPIETVSKMLGHNSLKTTQHYAKVLDSKTGYDMSLLAEKLSKRANVKAPKKKNKSKIKILKLYQGT
ncbi:site-specific integrase [Pedobacter fastidiosus]|uniref:Site-specific integrase n=1 Tax=Pedobacter fastidiosus TaxID=2765361 RepID=A0ABR7KUW8_9SPHI|nr:site-specific integrase [Pedobacter fastidiosus]MBC6111846.1 site-specific integrase [Pedobacter fastidiosus]